MWIMSPRKIKGQTVGGQVQDAKHKFQQIMILLLKFIVLCNTKAEISEENKIRFRVVTIIILGPQVCFCIIG